MVTQRLLREFSLELCQKRFFVGIRKNKICLAANLRGLPALGTDANDADRDGHSGPAIQPDMWNKLVMI